jgi:hypothetical protein
MVAFTPREVRYIKLGKKDAWVSALDGATLEIAHSIIPHELCLRRAWDEIATRFAAAGFSKTKTAFTRELRDFYMLGPEYLWITFARGYLWWAFAEPEVIWLGGDGSRHGFRQRKVIGAWSNADLNGRPLRFNELSSRLTKVSTYGQTICKVRESEHLLRCIRGEESPLLAVARTAKTQMLRAAEEMIAGLHWKDFEKMIDLIFSRSGWQRVSELGGNQKRIDFEMYHPATDARGFVQVKSQATQAALDECIEYYEAAGFDYMFFACHSPKGKFEASNQPGVHVLVRERLADMALKAGLYDWLMQRTT